MLREENNNKLLMDVQWGIRTQHCVSKYGKVFVADSDNNNNKHSNDNIEDKSVNKDRDEDSESEADEADIVDVGVDDTDRVQASHRQGCTVFHVEKFCAAGVDVRLG